MAYVLTDKGYDNRGIPEGWFEDDTRTAKKVQLKPTFSGEYFKQICCYPVIVESWEKRRTGSVGRKYREQFTEKGRETIARYHTLFYRWYLVTGTPRRVQMSMATLGLLQRAVGFFGGI